MGRALYVFFSAASFTISTAVINVSKPAYAFGDIGAFHPRLLMTKDDSLNSVSPLFSAMRTWSKAVIERTSAPAKMEVGTVRMDSSNLFDEPFVFWSGHGDIPPLSTAEISNLRRYVALGGMILVEDPDASIHGEPGAFGLAARRELAKVIFNAAPVVLDESHVIYKTFYLLKRDLVAAEKGIEALQPNGNAQVIFLNMNLSKKISRAQEPNLLDVRSEAFLSTHAIRFAVNLAMYFLCSNYKDDQVHAPFLMRRRGGREAGFRGIEK